MAANAFDTEITETADALIGPRRRPGDLYPFSLRQKPAVITENSHYYSGADNPWRRAIIPMEMLSVLFQYRSKDDPLPAKGPAVGLFADQEIRLVKGSRRACSTRRVRRSRPCCSTWRH